MAILSVLQYDASEYSIQLSLLLFVRKHWALVQRYSLAPAYRASLWRRDAPVSSDGDARILSGSCYMPLMMG